MGILARLSHWYAQKRPESHMYWRNLYYRLWGADDGLPIPPPELLYLVQGSYYVAEHLESGQYEARELLRLFATHWKDTGRPRAFLDFGCGTGRVIRNLKGWEGVELHGTDYNAVQVAWCRQSFPFVSFGKNELEPPLNYPDARFDFILANSVFTHLPEPLQFAWIDELGRVLRPGGCLVMTTMGHKMVVDDAPWALKVLSPKDVPRFHAGEMIVINEERPKVPDEYYNCVTWHPEAWVRQQLARGLDVVEFIPSAVFGCGLDAYVLRKPLGVSQAPEAVVG